MRAPAVTEGYVWTPLVDRLKQARGDIGQVITVE
jgi:hypothetical protein